MGKKHNFLGMDIEFLADGNLSLFMKYYFEELIDLLEEEIRENVSSPAKKGLQNIDESSTRLEKKYTDILHSMVAKLLWVAKRVRPYIEPTILFLWNRATKSTK